MDPIEASRRRADQLHTSAVAAGRDPRRPYEFACLEAAERMIDVAPVPVGDNRLRGGRAIYDAGALVILHEATGDPFVDALLVAHELGHVELIGSSVRSEPATIDPARPAEAVPTGVNRVADYSRRQRREVQMDLFAREFLLPRRWIRVLHLNEGLSAAAVATQLGAPLDVVTQQFLDALLLPLVEPQPERRGPVPGLTDEQSAATAHRGPAFLLEAGPGTGKTQTLVGRVDHLLSTQVDPEKILVLTFSNKAAGELAERIAVQHPAAAERIWVGTFHSFGLDIIRRFHDQLGLPQDPRLLDRSDAVEWLETEYTTFDLVHYRNLIDPAAPLGDILAAISRACDEVVDSTRYRALAEAMIRTAKDPDELKAAEACLEVATVFAAYERLKAERGCIDFGDLVTLPVRLCEQHPDVCLHLSNTYEHVLVDEYQDVNRASVRLLKLLTANGRNLWAVGDPKQSIYRFRGASAYNMARFDRDDFPGGQLGRLSVNYRSVPEVVNTFLAFSADIPSVQGSVVHLQADRSASGVRPCYRGVTSADQEVAAVAEAITELQDQGYCYRDQAVLSSGNDRLGRFAEGLERLGIPVLYLGSLFEREEIKDLLALLSILVDRRAMGLVRVAAMAEYAVPLADVSAILSHLAAHDSEPMAWQQSLESLFELSPAGCDGMRAIAQLLAGFGPDASPWIVLSAVLLDRSRLAAQIATSTDVRVQAKGVAIWQLLNFVRVLPAALGLPVTRLLDRIRRLVTHADDRDLRQLPAAAQGIDAVRLMTMHGSKGLEFPVVHIPGLAKNSFPRSPNTLLAQVVAPPDGLIEGAEGRSSDALRTALSEEQECLFFVAMSRARDCLFFYSTTKTANGSRRDRSPFVDRLSNHITTAHVEPALRLPPDAAAVPVLLTLDGPFTFTDYQLSLYERCPRRFFYTHILKVGGRRTETAFMRLHNAVQQVVERAVARPSGMLALDEVDAALDEVWASHGPADHGYADAYKRIASQLLLYFAEKAVGLTPRPNPQLRLPVTGGEIVITPDTVAHDGDGQVIMRRVRTGHRGSKEQEQMAAAAFYIAATLHTPGCTVELLHLGDSKVTPVCMTPKVLGNRQKSIGDMAADVSSGVFPLAETPTCPRCPAFFICGPLPAGELIRKFSS